MQVRITESGVVEEIDQLPLNSKRMLLNIDIQQRVRDTTQKWSIRCRPATHVVIMNLIACVNKKQRLFYSRQQNARVKSRYNDRGLNNNDIILAIDELESMGYLRNYIADRQYGRSDDKIPSWITATPLFEERFCNVVEKVLEAEELHLAANISVELRDENKKPLDYSTTDEIAEAERLVKELNAMNKQHSFISVSGENVVNIYSRVFNKTFGLGGRFFKAGVLAIKNKKTKDRLRMTIDSESVYEVDFDCLHINILADELNIKDSYSGDIYYKVLEPTQYSDANRGLVKYGVNVCLNARTTQAAAKAIKGYINEAPTGTYCFSDGFDLVRAIKSKLHHFKKAFCNKESTGLRLQNIDSWIAHWVLDEFVKANKPILSVHDSFIVKRQDVELLVSAMSAAYKKVVKVDRVVSMKQHWVEDGVVQQADCSR